MGELVKISIYGDSLALPRKGVVKYKERYFFLVQEWFKKNHNTGSFQLIDRAKGAATVIEILKAYEHDEGYFEFPRDVVMFHFGVVDCAPRPINESKRQKISKLPSFFKKIVIRYLHNNRSKIIKKGKQYVKTEKDVFLKETSKLLEKASQDYKELYVINICPTNTQSELHSPGFTKNINAYNELLKQSVDALEGKGVYLLDINQYISKHLEKIDDYILKEDGHHITPLTNSIISDMLIEMKTANLTRQVRK